MILIIDNYDSFTYNLVQLIAQISNNYQIIRNDSHTIDEILALKPRCILISPGPGRPEDAGICIELIKTVGHFIPILGVCLGHQAIGYAFGAKIAGAPVLMHGKTSLIQHDGYSVFHSIPIPFQATRYHSLVISSEEFPKELIITAKTFDNVIMGVRHVKFPIEGVQFHPESILTEYGQQIIANFLI